MRMEKLKSVRKRDFKIKIQTSRGWFDAPAVATSSPQLFVSPLCLRVQRKGDKQYPCFSRTQFVVTHKRTGLIAMSEHVRQKMAIFAASLLAQCGIPWESLRGRRSASSYQLPLSLTSVDGKRVWVLRVQTHRNTR
jgi:hypothetical protein